MHCEACHVKSAGFWINTEINENMRKRENVSENTRMCVCLLKYPQQDGEKNISRSALYCNGWLYSHRRQGSEANGKPATEAQFTSTFSNRVFSGNKCATIICDDGKRKFNLPWIERRHCEIFPVVGRSLIWGLKWSGRRGRSALYCMQCNGCALTQREGAIFSMLVHEDERPLGAHRNQVSSTARS